MDFKALSNPIVISGDSNNSKPSFFQKIRSPFAKLPKSSKKPVAIGLTILMVFALALGVFLVRKPTQLTPQASGNGVGISLKPAAITVGPNQEFNVDVFIDTGTTNLQVSAVQAKVKYNPAVLELKTVALKDYLPTALQQPQNTSGSTSFAVGSAIGSPKTGSGSVATITFKSLGTSQTQPSQITFDTAATAISAIGQTANVGNDFTPATVTFGTNGSPIPSTSPSPGTSAPETSITLEGPTGTINVGQEFSVKVKTRSDIDHSNLWNATITFPKDKLEVIRFNKTDSFITNWTEEYFSNTTGEISLTGGVTNPGFKTTNTNALMTTIVFKAKAAGTFNLNLIDPSNIYKNSDNTKILQTKRNAIVTAGTTSACNTACTGDSQCAATQDGCTACISGVCKKPTASASPTGFCSSNANCQAGYYCPIVAQPSGVSGDPLCVRLPEVVIDTTNSKSSCASSGPKNHIQWNNATTAGISYSLFVSNPNTPNEGTTIYSGPANSFDHLNVRSGQAYLYRVVANAGDRHTTPVQFTITAANCQQSPSPSPRSKGDGNNDGKVDLQDLSIMFTKWSPAINITSHFTLDFDDNLRINSFDYSQMKALLVQLKVIRQ